MKKEHGERSSLYECIQQGISQPKCLEGKLHVHLKKLGTQARANIGKVTSHDSYQTVGKGKSLLEHLNSCTTALRIDSRVLIK